MSGRKGSFTVEGKEFPILEWMAPVKTNAEALLANIIANPDDDTVRLIYADCLQEHEQEERAEFIRVQCEIARLERPGSTADPKAYLDLNTMKAATPPDLARLIALRAREREILFNHHDAHQDRLRLDWLSLDFAMTADSWKWSRGFVERIWIRAARWETHADRILAELPVRNVTLTTRPVHDINHGGRWKQITFTDGTEAGRLGRVFAHAGDGLEVELPREGWRLEIVERDEEAWSMRNRRVRMPAPNPEGHLLWEGPTMQLTQIAGLRGATFGPVIATARNGYRYQCNGFIQDVTQQMGRDALADTVRIEGRVTGEPILQTPD